MRRGTCWIVFAAGLGLLVLTWRIGQNAGVAPGATDLAGAAGEVDSATGLLFEEASLLVASQQEAQEQGVLGVSGVGGNANAASGQGGPWWDRIPRSNRDLARLFLTGAYGEDEFARHVLLNLVDEPISFADYTDLKELVSRLRAASARFRARVRELALEDRRAFLRKNPDAIQPLASTQEQKRAAAERLVAYLRERGESTSVEEALDKMEKGTAFSHRIPHGSSLIDGKVYANREFGTQPRYERGPEYQAAFALLRQIAMQEAGVIIAWFVARNRCTFSPDLTDVIRRIESAELQ